MLQVLTHLRLTDVFYYKASDGTDDSAPIQVTVNNTSTSNTAPVWKQNGQAYSAPGNSIAIVAGSPFTVTGLTATDVDPGQTLNYTVNVNPNGSATANYSASTETFTVNGITAGQTTVTLTANRRNSKFSSYLSVYYNRGAI